MRDLWNGNGARQVFVRIVIYVATGLLLLALFTPEWNGTKKAELLATLSYGKMLVAGVQIYADDNPGKKVYPVDVGAKTRLEYIECLIKNKVMTEFEAVALFEKHYGNPSKLKDLRPEDLQFRIANVSAKDAPGTIFLVTANYEEAPVAKPKSWFSWGRDHKNGIAVLLMDGKNAI